MVLLANGFPETEYLCASAIFVVGTSGIPLKLNYRSVKSYNLQYDYLQPDQKKNTRREKVAVNLCGFHSVFPEDYQMWQTTEEDY